MARTDYPEKYTSLIDDEVWAFIDRSDSFYPPDTAEKSVEQQREVYNRLCASFHAGYPEGVTATDCSIQTDTHAIPTRSYRLTGTKSGITVVYYHGGGYVVGGLDSHDDVCAEICGRTGYDVVSVDYRLSPEHNYPKDFEDALDAFKGIADFCNSPIVLCGDSAGANICAAVSHATKNSDVKPIGQVLIYGAFGSKLDQGTFIEHAEAPMITTKDTKFYKTIRTGGNSELFKEPTCAPLNADSFEGLPPTVLLSAECDPLSGDSGDYHEAILAAGGKSSWVNEKGLVHGYLRARNMSTRARDSFTRIVDAVSALGKNEWPY
ncbi:MAG: alpha/beta hydrolase [Salaquimonas sp.]